MSDERVSSGSFRNLDELVRLFPRDAETKPKAPDRQRPAKVEDDIHDRLFERAWREARNNQSP